MGKTAGKLTVAIVFVVGSILVGALFATGGTPDSDDASWAGYQQQPTATLESVPTETIPPYTPLPSLTPSQTLKPPPTFEPPTATPTASPTPSLTPTPTTEVIVSIPGLQGAESPTPTSTPGCEPREDWQLTYTVQFDDTLSSIAATYGTWIDELAEANCITDKNLIVIGQVLRVPGDAHPHVSQYDCAWEVLTPVDGSVMVPADGNLTFNWIGPTAPLNLIRVYLPDGTVYEQMVELRQNDTINLTDNLPQEGMYTWYVFPLDRSFRQIECLEGGPWTFHKPASAPTSTPAASMMQ